MGTSETNVWYLEENGKRKILVCRNMKKESCGYAVPAGPGGQPLRVCLQALGQACG